MCYGLSRDASERQGQIAHVDRKNSNNKPENLVFLCLEHHNAYDSVARQSKGFQPDEIRQFRQELDQYLAEGGPSANAMQVTRSELTEWARRLQARTFLGALAIVAIAVTAGATRQSLPTGSIQIRPVNADPHAAPPPTEGNDPRQQEDFESRIPETQQQMLAPPAQDPAPPPPPTSPPPTSPPPPATLPPATPPPEDPSTPPEAEPGGARRPAPVEELLPFILVHHEGENLVPEGWTWDSLHAENLWIRQAPGEANYFREGSVLVHSETASMKLSWNDLALEPTEHGFKIPLSYRLRNELQLQDGSRQLMFRRAVRGSLLALGVPRFDLILAVIVSAIAAAWISGRFWTSYLAWRHSLSVRD